MRKLAALFTVLAAAIALVNVSGQTSPNPDADNVVRLVEKLGSDNFAERERAKVELEKIGRAALDALRKAAASPNLETSRRAGELVRKIEEQTANDSILAPKQIHLKLQDVTVLDAIAELRKQSGYDIQITGNLSALASRKVTLDTGATTFWQAFDQLCGKAGLVEQPRPVTAVPSSVITPGIRRGGFRIAPPQVLPVVPNPKNVVAPQLQAIQPAPAQGNAAAANQAAQAAQILQALQQAQALQAGIAAPQQAGQSNGLIVSGGTPKAVPTSYSGAVRIRLLPATPEQRGDAQPGETVFVLDVDAEPRLQNFSLAATPQIDKAVGEQGQALEVVMDPQQQQPNVNVNPNVPQRLVVYTNAFQPIRRQAVVRLKGGEKPAKTLKEFSGALSAQALTPTEPLVVVKNVLKAAGQTEKNNGCSMHINSIDKLADGSVRVDVNFEGGGQNPIPGIQIIGGGVQIQQVQVQIGGNVVVSSTSGAASMPTLLDANGKSFRLTQIPSRRTTVNNNQVSSQATMIFSPNPGQGEADRLVLSGQRTVTFQVPFNFKDATIE